MINLIKKIMTTKLKENAILKGNLTFKLLTLGEAAVSKSCIICRYTKNKFLESHLTTVGIDFQVKTITIDNIPLKLRIWDTAGQEKFSTIAQQYYKNADGILLIFSFDIKKSLERIENWLTEIKKSIGKNINLVLLGNKCDIEKDCRQITTQEATEFASKNKVSYFETSAKNNVNIQESFNYLCREILKRRMKSQSLNEEDESNKSFTLVGERQKKRKCCGM